MKYLPLWSTFLRTCHLPTSTFQFLLYRIILRKCENYYFGINNNKHDKTHWHCVCVILATGAPQCPDPTRSSYIMQKPHAALGALLIRTKRLCVQSIQGQSYCTRAGRGRRWGGSLKLSGLKARDKAEEVLQDSSDSMLRVQAERARSCPRC